MAEVELPYPEYPRRAEPVTRQQILDITEERQKKMVYFYEKTSREYPEKLAKWRANIKQDIIDAIPNIIATLEKTKMGFGWEHFVNALYISGQYNELQNPMRALQMPDKNGIDIEYTTRRYNGIMNFLEMIPDGEISEPNRDILRQLGASYD